MSGETEQSISAWTVDSLHAFLLRIIIEKEKQSEERDRRYQQRFESQEKALQTAMAEKERAIEAALVAHETALKLAIQSLRDYYDTLLKERDARYETRSIMADRAVVVALDTVNKEFHEHLVQVREETQVAYSSAEKAISKAETATEKRFECVSADTPILCADLIWRPAGDLLVGDELIAFDETPTEPSKRRGRRFRRAVVTDNSLERDALLLVNTPEGSVRCNYKHPWLVQRQYANSPGSWGWVEAANLKPGDVVMHALDVWTVDRSWEAGWLAGMFDGEGCLSVDRNHRLQLSLAQRESPTSDLIAIALKNRIDQVGAYRLEPGTSSTPRNTQPFFHFIVTRLPQVLTLLGSVRPPRLLAKADEAWDGKPLGAWGRATTIESIESVGTGVIAQLSTSTGTYIANGFAMHNSVNEFRAQQADIITTFARKDEMDARVTGLAEKVDITTAQILQLAGSTMPRNEYDRAHVDLADKVTALEKAMTEKLEAQVKSLEQRLNQLQGQLSSIEAITR